MRFLYKLRDFTSILCIFFLTFFLLYCTLAPSEMSHSKINEEARWIATSHSWLDRTACKWISICGGTNWLGQTRLFQATSESRDWPEKENEHADGWIDGSIGEDQKAINWTEEETASREIPKYVLDYAPLVFLHPDEPYWPSDPAEHLRNTTVKFRDSEVKDSARITLSNLSSLNDYEGGEPVFLTSNDNVRDYPPWLESKYNVPVPYQDAIEKQVQEGNTSGSGDVNEIAKQEGWFSVEPKRHSQGNEKDFGVESASQSASLPRDRKQSSLDGGYSPAPAVLIVIEKENDVRDAFWFYFNGFNQGNKVFGIRFGNHVGDWEHSSKPFWNIMIANAHSTVVRFQHGKPKAIFTSRHSFGSSSYSYDAVEKIGERVHCSHPISCSC